MESKPTRRTRTTLASTPALDVDGNIAFAVGDRVDIYTEHRVVGSDCDTHDHRGEQRSVAVGPDAESKNKGKQEGASGPTAKGSTHLGVIDKVRASR